MVKFGSALSGASTRSQGSPAVWHSPQASTLAQDSPSAACDDLGVGEVDAGPAEDAVSRPLLESNERSAEASNVLETNNNTGMFSSFSTRRPKLLRSAVHLGRMSFYLQSDSNEVGNQKTGPEQHADNRLVEEQSAQLHHELPRQWHCLEFWRATPELLALPKEERTLRVTEELLVTSDGPFPAGRFEEQADLALWERIAVPGFFGLCLAGPMLLGFAALPLLWFRNWWALAALAGLTLVLACHPLCPGILSDSRFTLSMYRYFTFRIAWTDNVMLTSIREVDVWCAATVPHDVLPIAFFLGCMASNTFMHGRMVAGVASIVMYVPFLRYIMLFTHVSDVSKDTIRSNIDKGHCFGIVADGIAGIFCEDDEVALKSRKGLAKLSLRGQFPLVPTFCFGNYEAYDAIYDSCGILEGLSRRLRVSIFAYWGAFGPFPRRASMMMAHGPVVIPPDIEGNGPDNEELDRMHERVLEGIKVTFDDHKDAYGFGYGARKLKFK